MFGEGNEEFKVDLTKPQIFDDPSYDLDQRLDDFLQRMEVYLLDYLQPRAGDSSNLKRYLTPLESWGIIELEDDESNLDFIDIEEWFEFFELRFRDRQLRKLYNIYSHITEFNKYFWEFHNCIDLSLVDSKLIELFFSVVSSGTYSKSREVTNLLLTKYFYYLDDRFGENWRDTLIISLQTSASRDAEIIKYNLTMQENPTSAIEETNNFIIPIIENYERCTLQLLKLGKSFNPTLDKVLQLGEYVSRLYTLTADMLKTFAIEGRRNTNLYNRIRFLERQSDKLSLQVADKYVRSFSERSISIRLDRLYKRLSDEDLEIERRLSVVAPIRNLLLRIHINENAFDSVELFDRYAEILNSILSKEELDSEQTLRILEIIEFMERKK